MTYGKRKYTSVLFQSLKIVWSAGDGPPTSKSPGFMEVGGPIISGPITTAKFSTSENVAYIFSMQNVQFAKEYLLPKFAICSR